MAFFQLNNSFAANSSSDPAPVTGAAVPAEGEIVVEEGLPRAFQISQPFCLCDVSGMNRAAGQRAMISGPCGGGFSGGQFVGKDANNGEILGGTMSNCTTVTPEDMGAFQRMLRAVMIVRGLWVQGTCTSACD